MFQFTEQKLHVVTTFYTNQLKLKLKPKDINNLYAFFWIYVDSSLYNI